MGLDFFSKVRIFARSWNVLKNWYVYPLVYFNLTKKSHVIFETKSGLKLKIRTGTTDHYGVNQRLVNSGVFRR